MTNLNLPARQAPCGAKKRFPDVNTPPLSVMLVEVAIPQSVNILCARLVQLPAKVLTLGQLLDAPAYHFLPEIVNTKPDWPGGFKPTSEASPGERTGGRYMAKKSCYRQGLRRWPK